MQLFAVFPLSTLGKHHKQSEMAQQHDWLGLSPLCKYLELLVW